MFKIGEFSKLAMVTVKSLRFYDEEELLKPEYVDKFTNYRYYSTKHLYDLQKIISLRQAGLSIVEIRAVESGSDERTVLEKRKAELEREKDEACERFLRITKIIDSLKEGKRMQFQATIKEIPGYTVFYGVKRLGKFSDLNEFICGLGEECGKNNPDLKCIYPDYCFVTYLDESFTPTDFTAMYAQAVEKAGKESEKRKIYRASFYHGGKRYRKRRLH